MIGLENNVVKIADYDTTWINDFEHEKELISGAVVEYNLSIEHIGSTAVKGLCAKPIIDILIGIDRFENGFRIVGVFERLGYEYKGEFGIPKRHFFIKGNPRTHHVHMVEIGSNFWNEHLLFRDYLREHKDDRERYALLKRELALRYPNDRDAYLESKAEFIQKIIEKAKNQNIDKLE
jgi:GrpB-like predicted nucleotidyltransferase (UPF0157 family)